MITSPQRRILSESTEKLKAWSSHFQEILPWPENEKYLNDEYPDGNKELLFSDVEKFESKLKSFRKEFTSLSLLHFSNLGNDEHTRHQIKDIIDLADRILSSNIPKIYDMLMSDKPSTMGYFDGIADFVQNLEEIV